MTIKVLGICVRVQEPLYIDLKKKTVGAGNNNDYYAIIPPAPPLTTFENSGCRAHARAIQIFTFT